MEETSVLIAKAHAGDKEARRVLIEGNLGLVHHIVKRFSGRGYEAEDLFQIGAIGLMKAIDKFDLEKQVRFSTYAVPMIIGELKRFLRDDGPIKISRVIKENAGKVARQMNRLSSELGGEPRLEQLVEATGLSMEEVVMAMEASGEVESLYSSLKDEDGSEMYLMDRIVQSQEGPVGERVHMADYIRDPEKEALLDRMLLADLLKTLSGEERRLIEMRYFQDRTQSEIAKELGISQVQVSRMEKRILRRMREAAG